ncbi:hypothetical protein CRE_17630 [Caenorhabditis remanei]|uniref:DUF19 domain-containing protein n=1 Tax=Caenorhabditis remanei TaxID=31234 RepID=E3NJP9_CAERE|nr:hypothetical protein CRE_17630 [Caenorhabditis remanei]
MHQTLILLLFLVSVYSAVHADSVRYARELRNSTVFSGGPEHGKLNLTKMEHKVKPKRKLVRKLSSGPALTDEDERTLVDKTVTNLLKSYEHCQTSTKPKKDMETCIDKAQNKEKDKIETQLTKGNKCGGGTELEKCKDRILKKAVDATPLSIPIDDSYYGVVTSSKYGNVKIGLILAKNFDNCYDKNDKSDEFLKCLKAGGEKSPLIVAYGLFLMTGFCKHSNLKRSDEIAKQVGDFCDAKGDATCRAGAVGSIKNDAEAAINVILEIFCNEKDKDPNCQTKMTTTISEVIEGTQLDKESDKCKKETNIDKYIDCLKNISLCSFHSFISETFATKVADHCGMNRYQEKNCRKTGKNEAETLLKKVVEALFTNQCGETEKRERGYQLCLKTKLDKISIDFQLPAPKIQFVTITPLNDIVADAQYGKIAIGSTVGDKVKGCQKTNKNWKINDFINCLGTHEKAPLKTAMEEIGNQLTSHCAKVPSNERECRRDGEVNVELEIERFSLPFKLLDEVDLSKFSRKDENGEIKIGEILKKEAESCKNFKTRVEFFNCLKAAPLKTAKKALDAILTNFCREVFQKSEKEYTNCLNFDGSELETLSKLDNIPATIYALTDISKYKTTEEYGGIKIGEMLQKVLISCDGKKTVNEYFSCVSGPKGATTSPWIDITEKIGKELADVCGQKEMISDCRNDGKTEIDTKMREMAVDLIMNFCGKNAAASQQTYSDCISNVARKVDKLKKVALPISLRKEVSLPSLVIPKYGDIRIGDIVQNQAGMCKNMKKLVEVVDCLKTSKGVEPSPTKAARDSISDKLADYALMKKFGDDDWKQGVEEVRKEFKKAIQALISNFCRDNVSNKQYSYITCLNEGLINSEVLSQGYTPTDVFLQCSLKTTESDFNQCINTVTSQRLSSWTTSCATNQECTDAAKKSSAETATVAKVAAKLVSCDDSTCIQTEKQKVIDAFAENDGKYCNTPCKDTKVKVTAAVNKGLPNCSTDPSNLKCQAGFSLALKDSHCQSLPDDYNTCGKVCDAMTKAKANDGKTNWKIYFIVSGILLIVPIVYLIWFCVWCLNVFNAKCKILDMRFRRKMRKKDIHYVTRVQDGVKTKVPLYYPLPGYHNVMTLDKEAEKLGSRLTKTEKEEVESSLTSERTRRPKKLTKSQKKYRDAAFAKWLLKEHVERCKKEHDIELARFPLMGPIYIPSSPEVPPAVDTPAQNISLKNVKLNPDLNELWLVGSDVDDIELDPDFVLGPDDVSSEEDDDGAGGGAKGGAGGAREGAGAAAGGASGGGAQGGAAGGGAAGPEGAGAAEAVAGGASGGGGAAAAVGEGTVAAGTGAGPEVGAARQEEARAGARVAPGAPGAVEGTNQAGGALSGLLPCLHETPPAPQTTTTTTSLTVVQQQPGSATPAGAPTASTSNATQSSAPRK